MSEQLPPVTLNEPLKRYQMLFPNDEAAVLEYELYNGNEYDLTHTYVPNSQRGKNIADILSTSAIKDITHNRGGKVKLSCSYLSDKWIVKNPDYLKYVIRMISKK